MLFECICTVIVKESGELTIVQGDHSNLKEPPMDPGTYVFIPVAKRWAGDNDSGTYLPIYEWVWLTKGEKVKLPQTVDELPEAESV